MLLIINDYLFQWLETDFLWYLEEWETAVQNREGVTSANKKAMLLSMETLTGLKITSMITSAMSY